MERFNLHSLIGYQVLQHVEEEALITIVQIDVEEENTSISLCKWAH
jgi:hypothetical protein